MKKYLIIFSAAAITAASCNKKLDILPLQSVEEEVVLSTDAGVKNLLNGAYDMVSSSAVYGGDLFLYSELLAADGELRWEGTFNQPREIWRKDMLTTNSYVRDSWLDAYQAVNAANNILGALEVVNDDDRDRVRGEALFLRGSMFFELVKLYAQPYSAGNTGGPGIPLVLEATRTANVNTARPRNTIAETYDQIISDLTESQSLLEGVGYNNEYANAAAAAAQLARVYLQMEDYPAARDAANAAITLAEDMGYSLEENSYAALFNNSAPSSEDIFTIVVSPNDGANDMHLFWSIPEFGGRDGDVAILDKHLNLYNPLDNRLDLFYLDDADTYRSGKWKFQYRNLPVIRLTEMYLTRAEANFRAGTTVGNTPAADLEVIRERAGLPALAVVTLADILKERKLELAHEGQAIHDVRRLKLTVDGFAYNAPELVLPIPQREVDAAKGALEQNTGY